MFGLIPAAAVALTLAQPVPMPRGFDVRPEPTSRPAALTTMYVAFAGLQAMDTHSTLRAVSGGAREANPALRGVADNPGALIAVKAAAGATTIWMAEKMRKKHPRGAVVLMAVLNSAIATIVAHNYSVR